MKRKYLDEAERIKEALNAHPGINYKFQDEECQEAYELAASGECFRLILSAARGRIFSLNKERELSFRDGKGKKRNIEGMLDALLVCYNSESYGHCEFEMILDDERLTFSNPLKFFHSIQHRIESRIAGVEPGNWQAYETALLQSVRNEAMSFAYRKRFLEDAKDNLGTRSYWDAIKVDPNHFVLLNQLSANKGLYTIPLARIRIPFTDEEIISYSPEYGQIVSVPLHAVGADVSSVHGMDATALRDLYKRDFPNIYAQWSKGLSSKGYVPNDYIPFPIHPIGESFIREKFGQELATNKIVMLDDITISLQPLLSLRSLSSVENPSAAIMKFAIPAQLSTRTRTISRAVLQNGPRYSAEFKEFLNDNGNFEGILWASSDIMGAKINPYQNGGFDEDTARYLAYALRENLNIHVNKGEVIMPVAALFARTTAGKPLLKEIMESAGVQNKQEALNYFKAYSQKVLKGLLRLYLRYGMETESHQQNLNVVFSSKGMLERLVMQDPSVGLGADYDVFAASGYKNKDMLKNAQVHRDGFNRFFFINIWCHLLPIASVVEKEYEVNREALLGEIRNGIISEVNSAKAVALTKPNADREVLEDHIQKINDSLLKSPQITIRDPMADVILHSQVPGWGSFPSPTANMSIVPAAVDNPLRSRYVRPGGPTGASNTRGK